jgi:uncharacterized protein involved in exopolysaccharide biosynthesis
MQGSEAGSGGVTRRAGAEQTSLDLFNWAAIGRFFQLVGRSMARHKRVLFSVWLAVVGASVGLMVALPKTYEVQTTLQAQRTDIIAALSNRPAAGPDPSKQAAETVLRHENLVSLVQQTDLIRKWPERRAPAMRVKDAIFARLFRPKTPDDELESFVGLLEKQLWVDSSNQGTVSIGIHFPDPDLAFSLVDTALENFLEARHASEISSIGDAIVVLENRAAKSREALDETRDQLETLRAARAAKVGKGNVRRVLPLESETPLDGKTSQLLVQVQSRRRAIADLQEFRRRRATELEARVEELRSQYSASHPSVLDAQQSLETMRGDSPQVLALQRELAPMEAELKQRGLASDVPLRTSRVREKLGTLQLDAEDPREAEDPDIEYAKSQVKAAIARYNGLLDRVESARLEQDSAQAAFKYRYSVIKPAQKPRGPIKPKPTLIIPASVVAGLLLGIIATALIDLWSRKLVEPWQVEHTLGIPLLGEIRGL